MTIIAQRPRSRSGAVAGLLDAGFSMSKPANATCSTGSGRAFTDCTRRDRYT
ncbi:hypothetical protein [Pseudomonas sp.]|uniref:hypothetical protein n=1 Tax=Pseudomonas sp. TaxID=306 RepID=UPI003D09765C